ncbi:MAG: glycosyltransferase family 2 protein [Mycoplasma sp.]|nr:glycosyltransferase family 2 protein [Mycoplasma sp.]
MIKFSFLVAAYNTEKWIGECIDSLVNQDFDKSKYEIVVINDGSKDTTLKILKTYKNIKIISKENEGLSPTRNYQIDNATGDWFIFVDADDYVSTDFLKELDKNLKDNKNFYLINEHKDGKAEKIDNKIQKNKMDDGIASKVIHKNLFKNYRFPKHKFAIEDWDFFVHKYSEFKIDDLRDVKNLWYFYRYNSESLSKSNSVYRSRLLHAIEIFENPITRKSNLENNIIGHMYPHLYMMAKLWFPDLLKRVKSIKYKSKNSISLKIQYWIVKIGIFNSLIRKSVNVINE